MKQEKHVTGIVVLVRKGISGNGFMNVQDLQ